MSDLSTVNWYEMLQHVDTDRGFDIFQSKLESILDYHAPMKEVRVNRKKPNLPWITKGIQNSIKKQKLLYMLCACTAASVAMVIYSHLPHLTKPLRGGSPLGFIRD